MRTELINKAFLAEPWTNEAEQKAYYALVIEMTPSERAALIDMFDIVAKKLPAKK